METLKLQVDSSTTSLRIDQALTTTGRLSRGKARKIISAGGCYLNRKRTRKNSAVLKSGDKVELFWRDQELEKLAKIPQLIQAEDILYQDDEILAINKPAKLPSQATRTQSVFHVAMQCAALLGNISPLLVHRLDRDTTGVMILAKTKKAYKKLSELFASRQIEKIYHCWSEGQAKDSSWICKEPIGKIRAAEGRVFIDKRSGAEAETHFKVLQSESTRSLLEAKPITGRTHQIRVHLEASGLPIIGDQNYQPEPMNLPMMLHARTLRLPYWKTNRKLEITAPYPEFFLS